jgi:hypothetical protein
MNPTVPNRWSGAWIDVLAFALGLGLAWFFRWQTTDLVWSLWLSSLCVGFAMIVWQISEPLRSLLLGIAQDRSKAGSGAQKAGAIALFTVGTLFGLGFFALHFGGFHVGHSVFLSMIFPVTAQPARGLVDLDVYAEVFRRYWWFVPAAFLAERHAFKRTPRDPDPSVTAEAIARRKAGGDSMAAPYKNVIRMHLLIFFFVGAHLLKLDGFLIYAVVYAAYFFPWRLLRREKLQTALAA